MVCKKVKVGLPEVHNFDFSCIVVLLMLHGCLCFAGIPNKESDAVAMQLCVLQSCQNRQNINFYVNFGGYLAVAVASLSRFVHACTLPA